MLAVAQSVKLLFWNPCYNSIPFPSTASLSVSPCLLTDIAGMTGRERRNLLQELEVHPKLILPFLRAMQHLTALHGREMIEDPSYPCHRIRSAQHWSPAGETYYTPLLGHPISLSDDGKTSQPAGSNSRTKNASLTRSPSSTTGISGSVFAGGGPAGGEHRGYVGMLNQGSTCYLNSLLQALYHLTRFRKTIYDIPTGEESPQASGRSIPMALQRLFCHLQHAEAPVSTTELTTSFGWSDADSFIQHDIHELTRILLDNLEEKLEKQNGTPGSPADSNEIRSMFQGSQQNFIKVADAQYCGTRDEHFYDIQLVVKGNRNIYDSFDAIVSPEILDGKNKYCLERDGTKTYHRAEKGVLFTSFPPVLLLHLTRFDFDPEKGEMGKVLSRWDFYDTIDLSRYVTEEARTAPHPPDYFKYQLHSVLVHSGSDARFGHYYCFVKCHPTTGASSPGEDAAAAASSTDDSPPQWYKFNDEVVSSASLHDVFGANFGGFKLNYWGAEVPHTASGYLLIYLRACDIATLMTPVNMDAIPRHVKDQLTAEADHASRKELERAEAHLYGCLHFISTEDLEEQQVLLVNQAPCLQFPAHRSLRALLTDDALTTFLPFVAKQFGCEDPNDVLLFVVQVVDGEGTLNPTRRLGRRIAPHTPIKSYCAESDGSGSKQGCVFVINIKDDVGVLRKMDPERVRRLSERQELVLTHHKFYDPFELKIRYLDSMLLPADESITVLEGAIRHCAGKKGFLPNAESMPCLQVSLEGLGPTFTSVTCSEGLHPSGGELYVWQETIEDPKRLERVLYPTLGEFLHFHRHRVPVEVRILQHPQFPLLVSTELSDDMTYDQLQRYIAPRLGDEDLPHDRIRFSRHNPDTNYPYFMKNKKAGGTTLRTLLTVSNHPRLNHIVYCEVCPYTVTEIECSNSFQFEMWLETSPGRFAVAQHWLLLPEPQAFSMAQLFDRVVEAIQVSPTAVPPPGSCTVTSSTLRIVDVWKSRIYNVYDLRVPITSRFEESAEYRVELAPTPLPDVKMEDQVLLHVCHFGRAGNTNGKVVTHSDPFSLFVSMLDTLQSLRERIWTKLGLSEQQIEDWKLSFVHCGKVVEIKSTALLGEQLLAFGKSCGAGTAKSNGIFYTPPPPPPPSSSTNDSSGSRGQFVDPQSTNPFPCVFHTIGGDSGALSIFQSNQRDGTQVAFLGLEHAAPLNTKRGLRREERSLKIRN